MGSGDVTMEDHRCGAHAPCRWDFLQASVTIVVHTRLGASAGTACAGERGPSGGAEGRCPDHMPPDDGRKGLSGVASP